MPSHPAAAPAPWSQERPPGLALSTPAIFPAPPAPPARVPERPSQVLAITAIAIAALASRLLIGDWLASLGVVLLWAIWHYLPTAEGPPVLAMALTFQWAQVTSGVFYTGLTGRLLPAVVSSNYRPMVLIGMGCVASLLIGLALGQRPPRNKQARPPVAAPLFGFSIQSLYVLYVVLLLGLGFLQTFAWNLPGLTQGIFALGFLRLVSLYLLFRRLSTPRVRWAQVGPLLLFEVALGFTGYFANFREPLIMLALVLLEHFDARRLRHWLALSAATAAILLCGILWLGIRTSYRSDFGEGALATSRTARLQRVAKLSRGWFANDADQLLTDLDGFVDRLWAVYYPALAVARVPDVLPYEDGRILWGAVRHILTPRVLFPDKGVLPSDSEMVRKYSGVWVASTEEGTSIAFGYAAESYIDFGLPWMFAPVLLFGYLMGRAYRLLMRHIWHRELAVGLTAVVFWLSLYLFERSWIKTLGFSLTIMIYMGGAVLVVDRLLMSRRSRWRRRRGLAALPTA